MTTQQLIAAARERLSTPRIGKTILREMDRDILIIRRLVEALEAPANGDSEAHWRAVGTVVITAFLTSLVFGVGIAIGYNTAVGSTQEQERER